MTATACTPRIFSRITSSWTQHPFSSATLPRDTLIHLITWNVDFAGPHTASRIKSILSRLGQPATPTTLLFQELDSDYALPALLGHPLVKDHYVTLTAHEGGYNTATLLSHGIPVQAAHRLKYPDSCMYRDCLFFDIPVEGGKLRIANTHLESLPEFRKQRGEQLGIAAQIPLEAGVVAGVMGGDMNDICEDEVAVLENFGLQDVWKTQKEEGGAELKEQDGYTWGYQPATRFHAGRLDKILWRGGVEFVPRAEGLLVNRFGVGWQGSWEADWRKILG